MRKQSINKKIKTKYLLSAKCAEQTVIVGVSQKEENPVFWATWEKAHKEGLCWTLRKNKPFLKWIRAEEGDGIPVICQDKEAYSQVVISDKASNSPKASKTICL